MLFCEMESKIFRKNHREKRLLKIYTQFRLSDKKTSLFVCIVVSRVGSKGLDNRHIEIRKPQLQWLNQIFQSNNT